MLWNVLPDSFFTKVTGEILEILKDNVLVNAERVTY